MTQDELDCIKGIKEDFLQKTENGLRECAKWLDDNAQDLARTIAGGCKDWSVTFRAGEDGMFPSISISVNKIDMAIIDAYMD